MDAPNQPPPPRTKHPAQRFFLRGLLTLLPVVFTVFILVTAWGFVTRYVTGPVNSVLYWGLEGNALGWYALRAIGVEPYDEAHLDPQALPLELQDRLRDLGSTHADFRAELAAWRESREGLLRRPVDLAISGERLRRDVTARVPSLIGLLLSVLLVLSLGSLAGGYLGARLLARAESTLHVIPVVRSIYPYTKQLVDFFLAESKLEFDTVVALPYPRHGLWSIGFVTSSGLRTLRAHSGRNIVSVFVPSSPMPMTGYTIFAPAEDLIPLPFTVDEALRVIVSGGVLTPPQEAVAEDPRSALIAAARARREQESTPSQSVHEPLP